MYQYKLSPGNRVTWCHDFTEVKAQITRIYKTQAQILTTDFVKIKVPLDELELVPVVRQAHQPVVREQSVREQEICTLTDEREKDCTLTQGHGVGSGSDPKDVRLHHWIEEKMIKRSGKLHGPYRYERWRDGNGTLKSKYLGKSDE